MSTVAEIALAVQEVVDSGDYSINDLELEMALLDIGMEDIHICRVVDRENRLSLYREMAGNDWLRVVTLLVYWYLDSLMGNGYFKDVG